MRDCRPNSAGVSGLVPCRTMNTFFERNRHLKKKSILLILVPVLLNGQSANLPLGHWAYGFIERMEARGLVSNFQAGTKPFNRMRAAAIVMEIDDAAAADPGLLSPTESALLGRLKGELFDELEGSRVTVKGSEREPHLASWAGHNSRLHLDALAGGGAWLRSDGAAEAEHRVYRPYYGAAARGCFGGVAFYSDNRIFAEWGSGKYWQNYDASQGYPRNAEADSSRATWDKSESYFSFGVRGIGFEYGRDNAAWGPCPDGGLMFSGLAPAMDMLRVAFDAGPVFFTWFHGQLRGKPDRKWVSAHRVEFSPFKGAGFGIHDAVVYADRGLEPGYLNPVMPFVFSQHSLGDRDNVVFGLDAALSRIRGLKLYGEMLVDDFTSPWGIFSNAWSNKIAFTAGALWTNPAGMRDSQLRIEYTRIDPFVYTHRIPSNVYENYDAGLGSDLQPNSDRLRLRWERWFGLRLRSGASGRVERHGNGDRRTSHAEADGDVKRFLGGTVERRSAASVYIELEPLRDMVLRFEAGRICVRNRGLARGADASWNELALQAALNW
jgi:hypothetical protein